VDWRRYASGVGIAEDRGDVEVVDEETRAACAVGVLERVEESGSAGIRLRGTRWGERGGMD